MTYLYVDVMHFIVWMKSHYNLYLNCIYSSKCTATPQLNPLPSRRNTSTVHFQSITKTSVSLSKLTVFGCTKRSKAHEVEGTTQVALRWVLNLGFQKQEHKFPVAPVWFHFLQEKKGCLLPLDYELSAAQGAWAGLRWQPCQTAVALFPR